MKHLCKNFTTLEGKKKNLWTGLVQEGWDVYNIRHQLKNIGREMQIWCTDRAVDTWSYHLWNKVWQHREITHRDRQPRTRQSGDNFMNSMSCMWHEK